MAKIMDNPHGGRRMIRLSSEDIMMIVSVIQRELQGACGTYADLEERLSHRPLYLPEEAS